MICRQEGTVWLLLTCLHIYDEKVVTILCGYSLHPFTINLSLSSHTLSCALSSALLHLKFVFQSLSCLPSLSIFFLLISAVLPPFLLPLPYLMPLLLLPRCLLTCS